MYNISIIGAIIKENDNMAKSKLVEANKKIENAVVDGYKKIEDGVVSGYKKIEDGVVGGFEKISDCRLRQSGRTAWDRSGKKL